MSTSVRIPFRLRILIAVLFMVTAVVSFITFTMAKMFQEDKAAYVSDLASIIAVNASTASLDGVPSTWTRYVRGCLKCGVVSRCFT